MIDSEIVWIKLTYSDDSERVFRGTRSLSIINDMIDNLSDYDYYITDGYVDSNFIFDVKNKTFVNTENTKIEISITKPKFDRKVDEYVNSFI